MIHQDATCRVLRLVDGLDLPRGSEASTSPVREWSPPPDARRLAVRPRPAASPAADITPLPFDDGYFPLVLAIGVLPWVAGWGGALAELARITAPGGSVVATVDNSFRLNHLLDPAETPMPRRAARGAGPDPRRRGR